ncbi:hypothetical protein K437DRAFT_276650 [Tilletiaria anomala UBC 951]|uniref:Pentatricopeptide repeat domain-containing protein n=1 Tax=Tilletiaria anomala (strain ATCC 24038 / CBS 436.72 / UBC 951) TaxID=1037660 RepID=A0A066VA92_TILAU|nr:uncharacterized protein K437DRAFT_276650 [Tilletiaria anomala UBC 951]KDN37213.1 hypothetical protein K437DRAFT_276650 [Tilletiaria anomala UBC 951]
MHCTDKEAPGLVAMSVPATAARAVRGLLGRPSHSRAAVEQEVLPFLCPAAFSSNMAPRNKGRKSSVRKGHVLSPFTFASSSRVTLDRLPHRAYTYYIYSSAPMSHMAVARVREPEEARVHDLKDDGNAASAAWRSKTTLDSQGQHWYNCKGKGNPEEPTDIPSQTRDRNTKHFEDPILNRLLARVKESRSAGRNSSALYQLAKSVARGSPSIDNSRSALLPLGAAEAAETVDSLLHELARKPSDWDPRLNSAAVCLALIVDIMVQTPEEARNGRLQHVLASFEKHQMRPKLVELRSVVQFAMLKRHLEDARVLVNYALQDTVAGGVHAAWFRAMEQDLAMLPPTRSQALVEEDEEEARLHEPRRHKWGALIGRMLAPYSISTAAIAQAREDIANSVRRGDINALRDILTKLYASGMDLPSGIVLPVLLGLSFDPADPAGYGDARTLKAIRRMLAFSKPAADGTDSKSLSRAQSRQRMRILRVLCKYRTDHRDALERWKSARSGRGEAMQATRRAVHDDETGQQYENEEVQEQEQCSDLGEEPLEASEESEVILDEEEQYHDLDIKEGLQWMQETAAVPIADASTRLCSSLSAEPSSRLIKPKLSARTTTRAAASTDSPIAYTSAMYTTRIRRLTLVDRDYDTAERMLQHMMSRGLTPTLSHIAPFIEALALDGRMEDAQRVKAEAKQTLGLRPDVRIHAALIASYARLDDETGLRRELQELRDAKPEREALVIVENILAANAARKQRERQRRGDRAFLKDTDVIQMPSIAQSPVVSFLSEPVDPPRSEGPSSSPTMSRPVSAASSTRREQLTNVHVATTHFTDLVADRDHLRAQGFLADALAAGLRPDPALARLSKRSGMHLRRLKRLLGMSNPSSNPAADDGGDASVKTLRQALDRAVQLHLSNQLIIQRRLVAWHKHTPWTAAPAAGRGQRSRRQQQQPQAGRAKRRDIVRFLFDLIDGRIARAGLALRASRQSESQI